MTKWKTIIELRSFLIVWFGQAISLIGSGLTSFGLGLWVYENTGLATPFAVTAFFTVLPYIFLSPVAGVIVDRWDRRLVMLLSDVGAGLCTLAAVILYTRGLLVVWHVYLIAFSNALFGTFQQPAYLAASTQLVKEEQLGRAAGLMQVGIAVSELLSPVLAGFLLVSVGIGGILIIDMITFVVGTLSLVIVRFPSSIKTGTSITGEKHGIHMGKKSEFIEAWQYVIKDLTLIGLLFFIATTRFATGFIGALLVPMLLSFSSADVTGMAVSLAGSGMLAGSLIMGVWGGHENRLRSVLSFEFCKGLGILFMGLRPSVWLVAIAAMIAHFSIPFSNAANQAIWQSRVPQHLQGRVFSIQQMVTKVMMPVAYLLAGPLVDRIISPRINELHLSWLIGSGAGRGEGFIFVVMGCVILISSGIGLYIIRSKSLIKEIVGVYDRFLK